jgi:hypothetical protein
VVYQTAAQLDVFYCILLAKVPEIIQKDKERWNTKKLLSIMSDNRNPQNIKHIFVEDGQSLFS